MLGALQNKLFTLTVYAYVLDQMQDEAVSKPDADIIRLVDTGVDDGSKVEGSRMSYSR